MNPEQLEEIKNVVEAVKAACRETEELISDYDKCESEVARKYLAAAIKKHAAALRGGQPAA